MLRALLFIPAGDPDMRKWMVALWAHCMRRKYKPQAVVHQWCDVRKLMDEGAAHKVVVARLDQVGWLDVVSETPDRPPCARQRRPRLTGAAEG
jgi:hypothetical protein